jgi:hypothetical protein
VSRWGENSAWRDGNATGWPPPWSGLVEHWPPEPAGRWTPETGHPVIACIRSMGPSEFVRWESLAAALEADAELYAGTVRAVL